MGSALALSLLTRGALPLWAGVLLTGADCFALLFIERLGVDTSKVAFCDVFGLDEARRRRRTRHPLFLLHARARAHTARRGAAASVF